MIHVTCRLTAKNRDQLRNPGLGNRVWATFTFLRDTRITNDALVQERTFLRIRCFLPILQFQIDVFFCKLFVLDSGDLAVT